MKNIFNLRQTKIRELSFLLCILIILIVNSRLYSQTSNYKNLLKSILILPLIDSDSINHNTPNLHQKVEDKLNYANTYLTIELSNLVLSDSSKYYEEQLSRLNKIEKKKLLNTKDSILWLNEIEKQYLLVSLLNPSKSDTIYHRIIKIWFDIKKPISFIGNTVSSINFKIWLYEKSEERFKNETNSFTVNKKKGYYLRASILSFSNYNNIDDEKSKMELIESSLKLSERDSMLNHAYNSRVTKLIEINKELQSDSLNNYIESLLLKGLKLKSNDYTTNYNLFVFYYNFGVRLMQSMDSNLNIKELDMIQEKAKKYFKKSMPYAEAIGLKQEVEKFTK